MVRLKRTSPRSGWVLPLLVLLALAAIAGVFWFIASLLADPVVSAEGAAETEGYEHIFSIYGSGADRLHRPTEVATDGEGNVYVADSFKHRVVVFDKDGTFKRTIGSPAKVDGALKYPSAVEVDVRGRVYVTSSEPGRVVIFDAQGRPLRSVDVPDPLTMAIQADRLYVATPKGILVGDLDGEQVGQLLENGKSAGEIDRPTGMVVGDDGTIYLADSLNYRFQAVDKSGKSVWVLGSQPDPKKAVTDKDRKFGLPSGLTMGSDNVLYGIDAFNGEIIAISTEGEQLGTYGGWGRQDGEFYYPTGIEQVGVERFAVADTFNDRVQIVTVPSPRPNAVIATRRGLPWLVPVLAALALLLLVRRPVAIVTDAEAIRRADDQGMLPDLLAMAKVLYVPEGTVEKLASLVAADDRLIDVIREVELEAEEGEMHADRAIEIALGLRGGLRLRRVAVAFPNQEQARAAEENEIGILGERVPTETVMATP